MKISNSFVIKLVVVTILFKIASECGAAEHCIPSSYKVNPDNIVTASGFTPDETWQNFHSQLPQIGVLQNVKLKSYKSRVKSAYFESTLISKSIFANFDYITKFQCKKNGEYLISAIVPKETINYIPMYYSDIEKNEKYINSFLNFRKAKKICGNESYHLITSNYMVNFHEGGDSNLRTRRVEGRRFDHNKTKNTLRVIVLCGFNWKIWLNDNYGFQPNLTKNTWTHIVENEKEGIAFKEYDPYMQLQMISNAIKGE